MPARSAPARSAEPRQQNAQRASAAPGHQRTEAWVCDAGGASARPPTNSLNVFSSTSNPVLPSQLEPSGNVFSTSSELRNHRIDAVLIAGDGHGNGARRVRQIAHPLPVDFVIVVRDLLLQLRVQQLGEQALAVLAPIARIVFHHGVGLQVQRAVAPSEQIRLIDHGHLGADRNQVEEHRDVLGIQAHAAVTRAHAHAVGFVGAVNQIARPAQAKLVLARADCPVRQAPARAASRRPRRVRREPTSAPPRPDPFGG